MRIRLEALSTLSQKPLFPIYLIAGEETLLVERARMALRALARQQTTIDVHSYEVDGHFDWTTFQMAAYSRSLFSQKNWIELHITVDKPNEAVLRGILAYVEQPAADTVVILLFKKWSSSFEKMKWFQPIERMGVFLRIWSVTRESLPTFIQHYLTSHQLSIEKEAISLMVSLTEGNLLATQQLLDQLQISFKESDLITTQDIQDRFGDQTHYTLFSLTEAALAGDIVRTFHILQKLEQMNSEPTLVLWALVQEIRALLDFKPSDPLAKRSYSTPLRQHELRKVAWTRHPLSEFMQFLDDAHHIDLIIKGHVSGNPWRMLKQLSLQLCLGGRTPDRMVKDERSPEL